MPAIERSPRPEHARSKAAKKARKAVKRYGTDRTALRLAAPVAEPVTAPAESANERVDPMSLSGGPLSLAKLAGGAGCQVAATVASEVASGAVTVVCVWGVTPAGSRFRASWHSRAGKLATHMALLDGVNVGVTALRKSLVPVA